MRANYQQLGNYIRQVEVRNKAQDVSLLLGLSIEKKFIPSIANTIGTDMSSYKIVAPMQFAYVPVTSRNGDKITIALYKGEEKALISQAYTAFEITNVDALLPDYLMLWFKRPEFDRYARFKSHGSAREVFDWDEMCNVMLPVPPIEEQKRIVAQYQAVEKRIRNNEQLIARLEDTAQAIFRHRFVENIDPNNLPYGWRMGNIFDVAELYDNLRVPLSNDVREKMQKIYPYYGATCMMDYVDDYHFDGIYLLMGEDGSVVKENGTPYLQYVYGNFWVKNHAHVLQGKNGFSTELLYILLSQYMIRELVTGAVQAKLSQGNMALIRVVIPSYDVLKEVCTRIDTLFSYIRSLQKEISILLETNGLIINSL